MALIFRYIKGEDIFESLGNWQLIFNNNNKGIKLLPQLIL